MSTEFLCYKVKGVMDMNDDGFIILTMYFISLKFIRMVNFMLFVFYYAKIIN
jgi:hypothetical protein